MLGKFAGEKQTPQEEMLAQRGVQAREVEMLERRHKELQLANIEERRS
jgi:hypothetical protein